MFELLFFVTLPIVAFLYASVGHGGASGYLALMALFSFSTGDTKLIALTLNLFVAGIGFYHFYKKRFFDPKIFFPFIIGSIPASFIGGMLEVEPIWYKRILGVFLLIATLRLLYQPSERDDRKKINLILAVFIGAIIGLFSGMIGIGGGIILSPLILLLNWGGLKETAATSALFIFVNSAFGLLGHIFKNNDLFQIEPIKLTTIIVLATIGGYVGSKWGSKLKNLNVLKYTLGVVLLIACFKLWLV